MIFPCLRKKPETHEQRPPADVETTPRQRDETLLAIVRGHRESDQGATDYQGESEWKKFGPDRWGGKISRMVARNGDANILLTRPDIRSYKQQCRDTAREAKRRGAKRAILLHFNKVSYRVTNPGVEILIKSSKGKSSIEYKMADHFSDELNEKMGIPERRKDGVFPVSGSHPGKGILEAFDDVEIPTVLIEFAFLGQDTPTARKIVENEDFVCKIVADASHLFLKNELPEVD